MTFERWGSLSVDDHVDSKRWPPTFFCTIAW